jgi:hypothetical protein
VEYLDTCKAEAVRGRKRPTFVDDLSLYATRESQKAGSGQKILEATTKMHGE